MDDPRSLAVLSMAVSLIASGAPEYAHRSAASVAAELVGVADEIDDVILGSFGDDEEGGGGGGPEAPQPDRERVH